MTSPTAESLRNSVRDLLLEVDELQAQFDRASCAFAEAYGCLYSRRWADEQCHEDPNDSRWEEWGTLGSRIYAQAERSLLIARASMDASRIVYEKVGVHPLAAWVMLRPALESSLHAYWVLQPDSYKVQESDQGKKLTDGRVERSTRWALSGLQAELRVANRMREAQDPPDQNVLREIAEVEREQAAIHEQITDRGLSIEGYGHNPKKNRWEVKMVDTTSMIGVLPVPGNLKAAVELWWRLLSGMDHGNRQAQENLWITNEQGQIEADNQLLLDALSCIAMVRMRALQRFIELMAPGDTDPDLEARGD